MHTHIGRQSVLVNLTREKLTLRMIVDISNTNNGGDENIELVGRIEKVHDDTIQLHHSQTYQSLQSCVCSVLVYIKS